MPRRAQPEGKKRQDSRSREASWVSAGMPCEDAGEPPALRGAVPTTRADPPGRSDSVARCRRDTSAPSCRLRRPGLELAARPAKMPASRRRSQGPRRRRRLLVLVRASDRARGMIAEETGSHSFHSSGTTTAPDSAIVHDRHGASSSPGYPCRRSRSGRPRSRRGKRVGSTAIAATSDSVGERGKESGSQGAGVEGPRGHQTAGPPLLSSVFPIAP